MFCFEAENDVPEKTSTFEKTQVCKTAVFLSFMANIQSHLNATKTKPFNDNDQNTHNKNTKHLDEFVSVFSAM